MRESVFILIVTAALAAAGCRDSVRCDCNQGCDCGPGLSCVQAASACAALDSTCASGQRFDPSAGALGGMCVGEEIEMGADGDDLAMSDDGSTSLDMASSPDMTVVCGYAGEPCCTGPFAPCNTGLACSGSACIASDVMVVGEYTNISTFHHNSYSMHYDGSSWTLGPPMGADADNRIVYGVWGDRPNGYWAVGSDGKLLLYNSAGPSWLICGNFGCADPMTTNQLQSIFGFGQSDFWIGGSSVMDNCGTSCTAKTTGISGSWGAGQLWGTSSTDLWAAAYTQALHWNGTTWTSYSTIPMRGVWGSATNDVWAADTQIYHWNGTAWSPPYAVTLPGNVVSMSGSGPNDAWGLGYNFSDSTKVFTVHWDGTAWTVIALPKGGQMSAIWAASKKDAFACSYAGDIFHWDGSSWTTMTLPTLPAATLSWHAIYGSGRARP